MLSADVSLLPGRCRGPALRAAPVTGHADGRRSAPASPARTHIVPSRDVESVVSMSRTSKI